MATLTPIQENIRRARRVSVPLLAVTTPDPWHAMRQIFAVIPDEFENPDFREPTPSGNAPPVGPVGPRMEDGGSKIETGENDEDADENGAQPPASSLQPPASISRTLPVVKVEWDFARGFVGRGKAGVAWVKALASSDGVVGVGSGVGAGDPFAALIASAKLPPRGILAIHLADKWAREPAIIQAIWNLRDEFKADVRTLVLLSKGEFLPAELADDVITFDDPLPGGEQLAAIICEQCEAAGLPSLAGEDPASELTLNRAVEAVRGLSAFGAEQVTALSLSRDGLDIERLWERKRQLIEQTPGLKVYRGDCASGAPDGGATIGGSPSSGLPLRARAKPDSFDQIGGCEVVKKFLTRIMAGGDRPNAVVFVDEIEKSLGGATGDLSGVTQDQLGSLLSYMQDNAASGMIFIGPPGAAKSAVAKAAGAEGGIPTIQLDLGAAKGSLVGQSEQQLRAALKVITAVSNGRSLWIATSNSLANLPPELKRRFTLGTFFFDLPSKEERRAIWNIWLSRFDLLPPFVGAGLKPEALPEDEGWTGAEIQVCCRIASMLRCTLAEASAYVVPVSRSAADQIAKLRSQADGRFLSASYPGVFQVNRQATSRPDAPRKKRTINLE